MKRIIFLLMLGIAVISSCQKEIPTELNVSPTELSFDKNGGTQTISLLANKTWMASSSAGWCSVSKLKGDASQSSLSISCDANLDYDERTCTITINSEELTKTISIKQSASEGILVSPANFELSKKAQTIEVEVKSNVEYSVAIDNACKDWISQVSTKALASNKVSFQIAENETYDNREGKITISQTNGTLVSVVTVKQSQTDGLFVEQNEYEVSEEEQTLSIKVKSNIDYNVTVEETCNWISVIKTKALSESTIEIRIEANGTKQREGKITIGNNEAYDVVTIVQEPAFHIDFKDTNFKAYCVKKFDTNMDGEISKSEALAVTRISVDTKDISSLEGIEHFTNLKSLSCFLNFDRGTGTHYYDVDGNEISSKLTSLDVSKNTALTELNCQYNKLTSLDISKNTALETLRCSDNQLISLDASKNIALTELLCEDNQLTSLVVAGCDALTHLRCDYNQLTNLNVSKNTALTDFYCENNQLTTLDVSKNTALVELWCSSNQMSSLDVSKNTALTELICYDNQLTVLDVSKNTALTQLYCFENKLSTLDISKNTSLTDLNCCNNQLSSIYVWERFDASKYPYFFKDDSASYVVKTDKIRFEDANFKAYCVKNFDTNGDGEISISEAEKVDDISCDGQNISSLKGVEYFTALRILNCKNNQLTSLDVSGCTTLAHLSCSNNRLTSLDVKGCTNLNHLFCYHNQLTTLDVSGCAALTDLTCSDNRLTSLNVSVCTALTDLDCLNNRLTSLEVSDCTSLANMYCDNNRLTILDVRRCTVLSYLSCSQNQLTSLNASDCSSLHYLNCFQNQLTNLNVSGCTSLTELNCYNNQLAKLDISDCIYLVDLECSKNRLTSLDVRDCPDLTELRCASNQLTSLDISRCTNLNYLSCYSNNISAIYVWKGFNPAQYPDFRKDTSAKYVEVE